MSLTEVDARELVEAHRAGDERAFTEIARVAYPSLYHHAQRRLRDHHAAEDAVQETFARAFRALPRFEGDFRLHAWLHRILANVCADEGSRRGREVELNVRVSSVTEVEAPDPLDLTVTSETRASVTRALVDLPDSYRSAVALRYLDDLSYREIAAATGVSEENARARVARGRAALQRVLHRGLGALVLVVPGLRRPQPAATSVQVSAATSADVSGTAAGPLTNVTTQLAGHAAQLAPTVTRLTEASASMGGGRSTMVANVVGAVAAAMVPAAYTIIEQRASEPSAAVVAAEPTQRDTPDDRTSASVLPSDLTATGATTVTILSAGDPTIAGLGTKPPTTKPTRSTAASPAATPQAPPVTHPDRRGAVASDELTVARAASQLRLSGAVGFAAVDKGAYPEPGRSGTLSGAIDLGERAQDGRCPATAAFDFVLDGTSYALHLSGQVLEEARDGGGTRYRFTGTYQLDRAADLGLDTAGPAVWTLDISDGTSGDAPPASSVLRLSLGGQAEQSGAPQP